VLRHLLLCLRVLLLGDVSLFNVLVLQVSLDLADAFEFVALFVGSANLLLEVGHAGLEEVLEQLEVLTLLVEETRVEEELRERLLHPFKELRDLISLVDEDAADIDQVALDFLRRLEVVEESQTDVVLQRRACEGLHVGLVH